MIRPETSPISQVKVMLRVCPSFPGETGSFMKLDLKRKQVTLYDPSTVGHVSQTHRKMGVAAPKMFAFDSIFEADTTQVFFDFISRIAMYRSFIRKENRKPKIKIKKTQFIT